MLSPVRQCLFVKDLVGHSGCRLQLYRTETASFVRKSAGSAAYTARLKAQCFKQMEFAAANIHTPKVLCTGDVDGHFYFDMQFIQGGTLAECIDCMSVLDVAEIVGLVCKTMWAERCQTVPDAPTIFMKKIGKLQEFRSWSNFIVDAFCLLREFDWSNVRRSSCHGDLTLENILITSQKDVYFIDFLDSFYDSWMMDAAKLLQYLELGWSFRAQPPDAARSVRLLIAKEVLLKEIERAGGGAKALRTIYHLLLLNVLRIYPYAQDEPTLHFLDCSVKRVLAILRVKFMEAV